MARRGFFRGIAEALGRGVETALKPIERLFEGAPRRAAPREPGPPPTPGGRGAPPRPPERRRERRRYSRDEQWHRDWQKTVGRRHRTTLGHKPSFQDNKDFVRDMASAFNIPVDEQEEFWKDYMKYMVRGKGGYRMQDLRNPFWQNWNIHPDDFDWYEWREAMGYPHGARGRG